MQVKISDKQIGERLKAARLKSKLSVIRVAKAVGISRQHVYNVERGGVGMSVDLLQRFSRALEMNPGAVLTMPNGNGRRRSA